jgi:hypothetical protein
MPDNKSFHIDPRLGKQKDVIRTYNFDLTILEATRIDPSLGDIDNLVVRIKSCVIPSRGNEIIESYFMGMKQLFPGKPVFGHTLNCMIEEGSDQKMLTFLNTWNNKIFNTVVADSNAGASVLGTKRGTNGYASDMILQMYNYDGTPLTKAIKFFNSWPSNVADASLDFTSNDSVKYSVDFSYDRYELIKI